ncbi:MAG: MOSC domain-containing protein [Clostridiales bacterium]|nr:MOSC domain-containing protein [Clostridiales bacterium]
MAKILAINISETKGVIKKSVDEVMLIEDFGIENDAHAGKWHRQVSLLGQESVDKMIAKGLDHLVPGVFAENLTTEGIILYELPVGTVLQIGETVHEVTQIGKECHTGCEIKQITGDCVMPREGIFTKVLKGGILKPGDEIVVLDKKEETFIMK